MSDSKSSTFGMVGKRKKTLALTSAAILASQILGLSSVHASPTTIGYSAPFLSAQFEITLQDGVVAAAARAGLTMLAPTNADMDSGKQITDVNNLIAAGAKGLFVVVNDSKAIIPALDAAAAANVPVVSVDIGPDGGKVAAIVRADNIGMGALACKDMAKAIGYKGKVLSLMGAATSINGRERTKGFHDCMLKFPKIKLIERPTDWDPAKQVAALQTVLTANPDLKGFFMQSDWALSATLNVLKQAKRTALVGKPGHIYAISIDAGPQSLALVRSGVLDAEISQPLDLFIKYGVRYLQDALAGKTLAAGPTDHGTNVVLYNGNPMDLLPATLVTKANVNSPKLWGNQG